VVTPDRCPVGTDVWYVEIPRELTASAEPRVIRARLAAWGDGGYYAGKVRLEAPVGDGWQTLRSGAQNRMWYDAREIEPSHDDACDRATSWCSDRAAELHATARALETTAAAFARRASCVRHDVAGARGYGRDADTGGCRHELRDAESA
jgi:hypothetical protein